MGFGQTKQGISSYILKPLSFEEIKKQICNSQLEMSDADADIGPKTRNTIFTPLGNNSCFIFKDACHSWTEHVPFLECKKEPLCICPISRKEMWESWSILKGNTVPECLSQIWGTTKSLTSKQIQDMSSSLSEHFFSYKTDWMDRTGHIWFWDSDPVRDISNPSPPSPSFLLSCLKFGGDAGGHNSYPWKWLPNP